MKKTFLTILILLFSASSVFAAPVAPPSDFTMGSATNTTIRCTWTNNTDNADSVRVLNIADSTWVASTTISEATSLIVRGLTPGTSYSWMAWADSAGTASANSNSATLSTRYPELGETQPPDVLSSFTTGLSAQSWSANNNLITSLVSVGASDKDSTTRIPIDAEKTTFYCTVTGTTDSIHVALLFYAGYGDGAFMVTLQDSLIIDAAGFYRKTVQWGANQYGYMVLEGRPDNDVDGTGSTTISDMKWLRRRTGVQAGR